MSTPQSHNKCPIHLWQYIDKWRHLPEEVIARLPKGLRADISERVVKSAKDCIADDRRDDMAPIVKRRHSPTTKQATKIVVVLVGAVTFSAGTQVLTSRLGAVALPAAMIGGGMASFLVDDRATKVITNMRVAFSIKQELKAIERQQQVHPPVNEFDRQFYSAQIALLRQIEGKSLEKQLAIDGIFAGFASAAEFAISLWIVVQLGLPGGLLIEAIAGSLPVTIIWIAAAFQSDTFELPERYLDLMKQYLSHLFPPQGMPEAEVMELLANKEAQEAKLDFLVTFVAQGDSTGRLKNIGMAEADYDIKEAQERKKWLEKERDRIVEERLFQHRAQEADLPNQFTPPEIDLCGSPQEIKERQRQVERMRLQWVEKEKVKLREVLSQDLKLIAHRYSTLIGQCEEDAIAAQKRYDDAYRRWKEDNEEFQDDFGGAA